MHYEKHLLTQGERNYIQPDRRPSINPPVFGQYNYPIPINPNMNMFRPYMMPSDELNKK